MSRGRGWTRMASGRPRYRPTDRQDRIGLQKTKSSEVTVADAQLGAVSRPFLASWRRAERDDPRTSPMLSVDFVSNHVDVVIDHSSVLGV